MDICTYVPSVVNSLGRLLAVKLCYAVNPVVQSFRVFLRAVNCLNSLHVHGVSTPHTHTSHTRSQTHGNTSIKNDLRWVHYKLNVRVTSRNHRLAYETDFYVTVDLGCHRFSAYIQQVSS